jgi:hypothetical protein
LDESPKLNKLGEVLNRYGSRVTKLGYPLIIAESMVYHPIFALANVKNPRRDVFWLPTMNPRRMPKRCFATVSKVNGGGRIEDVHILIGAWVTGTTPNLAFIFPL